MNSISRRVSPSLVLSLIAIVLALGGSAIAAKRYLITNTQQISPAVLKKLTKMAAAQGLAGAPGAPGAPGAAGANGAQGLPGPGAEVHWAVVDEDGNVKRHGTGDTSAEKLAEGTYAVEFDRNVENCAYQAAIGRWDNQDTEDPGFATVVAQSGHPNAVFIQTYAANAVDSTDGADKNFHLAVFC
jgi:hypothetical protein